MENGQWRLLSTYPLFTLSYIIGKIGGQFTAQWIVFNYSYGISMAISLLAGGEFFNRNGYGPFIFFPSR